MERLVRWQLDAHLRFQILQAGNAAWSPRGQSASSGQGDCRSSDTKSAAGETVSSQTWATPCRQRHDSQTKRP